MNQNRKHLKYFKMLHRDRIWAGIEFLKRFGFVLFIAIMFILLTFTVAFSQSTDALNLVEKGRAQLKQNNLQAATANFDKALDLTKSKNTDVLNAIGEAWLEKAEFAVRAKTALEKSEGIKPTYKASMLLGDLYLAQGNGGQAITNYEHAAVLDVRNGTPYYKIGIVYVRSTNKDAALESFQKAVSIDPTYAPAYKELAELYYAMKNGMEAVKAQEKYMQLSGTDESNLVRMGYYKFMARDFTKANEAFEAAYQKGLLKDTGLRYYALSLLEGGDYARSQEIFEDYLGKASPEQIEPSDYTAYGKVLLKLEQDSLALIAFGKSLKIDSRQAPVKRLQAETLYSLGRALYNKERFKEADTTFRALIDAQPTITVGYLWAGRSNAQLDPETENGLAKPFYEKLIEIGQANPEKAKNDLKEAYSYLGYYWFVKNNTAQSRAYWEKVLTIDPLDERAKEALKAIKQ